MRDRSRSRRRLPLNVVGILTVGVLVLAACTPEPPPPPTIPVVSPSPSPSTTTTTPTTTTTSTTAPPPTASACSTTGTSEAPAPSADDPVEYVAVTEGSTGGREVHTFEARSSDDRRTKVDQIRAEHGTVLSVEVDVPVYALAIDDPVYLGPPASSDGPQWQIDAAGYEAAWASAGQGAGVRVAVVDTGVDAVHEDLIGAVVAGADFVGGKGSSVGDGQTDPNSHGTHVAGIVAARDNAIGGIGGAPQVTIVPVRVLDRVGQRLDLRRRRRDPVGGQPRPGRRRRDQPEPRRLVHGCDARRVGLCRGPGRHRRRHGRERLLQEHSELPGHVRVRDPGRAGRRVDDPDQRPLVVLEHQPVRDDLGARERDLVDRSVRHRQPLRGPLPAKSGTSMATPGVAAAAALVKAKCPAYTPEQIRNRLVSTALDLGTAGPDATFGAGLVQADAAVAAAPARWPMTTTT